MPHEAQIEISYHLIITLHLIFNIIQDRWLYKMNSSKGINDSDISMSGAYTLIYNEDEEPFLQNASSRTKSKQDNLIRSSAWAYFIWILVLILIIENIYLLSVSQFTKRNTYETGFTTELGTIIPKIRIVLWTPKTFSYLRKEIYEMLNIS